MKRVEEELILSAAMIDPERRLLAATLARASLEAESGDLEAAVWILSDGLLIAEVLELPTRVIVKKVGHWLEV